MILRLDQNTGLARPDLPLVNAYAPFDASANGRYELQVETGIFDLYVMVTGYSEPCLFYSGFTVFHENFSIDVLVGLYPSTGCSSPQSTSTQFSLTMPSTPQTVTSVSQSTSSTVTSTPSSTPYTFTPWVTPTTVTSVPSSQMSQPIQPTAIQSTNNTPQVVSALAVIAAVVMGAVFVYTRRKEQSKVKKAKRVDSKTGKNFCIECGSELRSTSKFCDNCGTKQP